MFDKEALQTLLNLPDIAIDRVVPCERKTHKIYVHSTLDCTHCHGCGQPIDHFMAWVKRSNYAIYFYSNIK